MRARRVYQYKAICSVCVERGLCEERGEGGTTVKRAGVAKCGLCFILCLKYLVVWTEMLIEESQTDDCLLGS